MSSSAERSGREMVTSPVDRIVAANDPRNGTIAERLIRLIERPDLEPDADGLYPDVKAESTLRD